MGVSRRTVLKWLTRYEAEGEAGLQDRSSRPHQSPNRLPRSRVKAIRRLRKRKWTSSTIARHLSIPRSTVGVWLRRRTPPPFASRVANVLRNVRSRIDTP